MHKFETEIIHYRDTQGSLSAAGLRWVEARYGVNVAFAVTFWFGIYFAVIFGIGAYVMPQTAIFMSLAEGAGLGALGSLEILRRYGMRERTALFYIDYIALPQGLPYDGETKRLPIAVSNIGNIEVWGRGDEFWLLLYTTSADSHVLGRGFNEFQARKVVALLSNARDALRESLAQPSSEQPGRRRPVIN